MTITLEQENNEFDEAKKQVLDYLEKRKHAHTSDVLFNLDFDPELLLEVLDALESEGKVEGRDIQLPK
ncbi:MAG: hypothetical protein LBE76_09065 [Nitrososphaerota archaeon]|jgi:hypothetical protein|nr:hypothetical protein [Nitrososphaerota archaeon]